jgi:hypothetical protein
LRPGTVARVEAELDVDGVSVRCVTVRCVGGRVLVEFD